ncbi:hypothetical protein [Lutispora sp.]|uniref:hypothetical protein n=1 Tax=Lutispora sp. TaxID=2828727 RepID=UPI003565D3A9
MGERIPFRTTVDADLLRKLKVKALENNVDVNDILEELAKLYLEGAIKNIEITKRSKK